MFVIVEGRRLGGETGLRISRRRGHPTEYEDSRESKTVAATAKRRLKYQLRKFHQDDEMMDFGSSYGYSCYLVFTREKPETTLCSEKLCRMSRY